MNNSPFQVPEHPVEAMGLRVETDQLYPQKIKVDSSFEQMPIAHAAGIPIYVKRLLNAPRIEHNNYIIVRMMSRPSEGLAAMDWQYGGCLQPAPPVLVARSDSIQFNRDDWEVLDDFEMVMLDDGPRKVTRKDFIQFVKEGYSNNNSNIVLQALYPKGSSCKIQGLTGNTELNGMVGKITGTYQNGRVGVKVDGNQKNYGLKPKNFTLLKGK